MQPLQTPADGLRASLVIVGGYLPIGFAAGIVGAEAGMSPAEIALLSLLVFAGSAQFVFANLVAAPPLTLITTIFLINFRHFLYSAALSRRIRRLPLLHRAAIGAQLTDETFAMMSTRAAPTAAGGMLALNFASYSGWFAGNITGALVGARASAENWGADFLLIAMFAGLLMLNITAATDKQGETKRRLAVAAIAAVLMVGLEYIAAHAMNIIAAAGLAAAAGVLLEKRGGKQ